MFYPPTRVSQLDSAILDNEVFDLIGADLQDVFAYFRPEYKTRFAREIKLVLRLAIFKATVWDQLQSYGMKVQNLKMRGPGLGWKKAGLAAFIVGDYAWERFELWMLLLDGLPEGTSKLAVMKRNVARLVLRYRTFLLLLSKLYSLAAFVNYLLFLVRGHYISLRHRLLRLRINEPVHRDLLKYQGNSVLFEFQNRQLVWNTLTEFLVFTLPMLRLGKMRTALQLLFVAAAPEVRYGDLKERYCAVCYDKRAARGDVDESQCLVTNPHVTSCGHVYCYVCVGGKLELSTARQYASGGGEGAKAGLWKCLRCGEGVEWAVPMAAGQ